MSDKSIKRKPRSYMRANGLTDIQTQERTDITKVMGAFRDYANAPKNVGL